VIKHENSKLGLSQIASIHDCNKVNFLIAGTQKGGTTALYEYLKMHSEIIMPELKELHFFDKDIYFTDKEDYEQYHKYYDFQNTKLKGEATPIYMYWETAPERIYKYNPDMKLILLLRNPISRAYSQWNMEIQKNNEYLSFSEAIRSEKRRLNTKNEMHIRHFSYLDRGLYSKQINRIKKYFPSTNVLILKSENLLIDHYSTLNKITDFLNISRFISLEKHVIHTRKYPSILSESDYNFLYNFFFLEIKKLEEMLQWDCSTWLQPYDKYLTNLRKKINQ